MLTLPVSGGLPRIFICVEYSWAGHVCCEHLIDVISSSIATELDHYPMRETDLTSGMAGLVAQPGCNTFLSGIFPELSSCSDLLDEVVCK
jgi:hypothetical protein